MSHTFMLLPPLIQALLAGVFTWGISVLGAAAVFALRQCSRFVMNAALGFAAGVMTAASFWSLLIPAVSLSEALGKSPVWIPCLGFTAGGLLLFIWDEAEERFTAGGAARHRQHMLFSSVTLHNIPEGLAVGVAFGSLPYRLEGATFTAACMITLGIGLQNLPEGAAVSLPLLREGISRPKAFRRGVQSGAVEVPAALCGAALALQARSALPFLLSFSAGAMMYAVVKEMIPACQGENRKAQTALSIIAGLCLMTAMDVGLG